MEIDHLMSFCQSTSLPKQTSRVHIQSNTHCVAQIINIRGILRLGKPGFKLFGTPEWLQVRNK